MKKLIIFVVILLVISLGVYYFLPKKDVGTDLTNNIANNVTNVVTDKKVSTPAENVPKEVVVDIKDFAFSPSVLNVKVGTKVTWTNKDFAGHTVVSDTGNLFNSPTISQGESFSYTFTSVGSVAYHCSAHPMMKAVVNVNY